MSNTSNLTPRDRSEELKFNLLKELDAVLCNDNNVICWGAENTVGLNIVQKEVVDTKHVDIVCTSLSVKFYINKLGQVISTTIK
jgi:hypothetical protein